MMNVYAELQKILWYPSYKRIKTETERFAGAEETFVLKHGTERPSGRNLHF
jgi:hypothetical protein